ncbi:type II toxin-antitoxin system RelE/ParE family toxin [Bdellovibrio sp. HCB288]|uniref:type II toxin-antitoxin system RelE/ParE family toxin n=1 Tax=Bdellovibrio sp. HCB288 TaxID=3394355 RepID=UPI0039B5CF3F
MTKNTRNPRRILQSAPIYAIVERESTAFEVLIYENKNGTEPFSDWLDLLDNSVRGKVIARVDRLKMGLPGNAKALKNGLYELKFKNPAFRIYYTLIGKRVILLVSGGDKNRQTNDIEQAKEYLADYRRRYEK